LFAVSVKDFEGRTVTVIARPERIISLAPIATRIIVQFSLLNNVIGLDSKSFDMDLLPISISKRGTNIVDLGNAKSIDEESILRLYPDIIIAQYDKTTADKLSSKLGIPVLCIQNRVGMDYELFDVLGHVLFSEIRASEIVSYTKGVVTSAESIVKQANAQIKPRVYVATDSSLLNIFPQDPIIVMCGGINVASEITNMNYWGGATVDIEYFLRSKPDVIIVWLSFDATKKLEDLKKNIRRREFENIPAIKNSQIYSFIEATSGKDYFYTMVSISETLSHFYPSQYNERILEQDIRKHLAMFYPALSYNAYIQLRDTIDITK
jgi:iron complex transport system substrate-binding protein